MSALFPCCNNLQTTAYRHRCPVAKVPLCVQEKCHLLQGSSVYEVVATLFCYVSSGPQFGV